MMIQTSISQSDEFGNSEQFLLYYDIFVQNAFGNFRDVLREVSYSPLMAENLSLLGSKSSAYMLEQNQVKAAAGKSCNDINKGCTSFEAS